MIKTVKFVNFKSLSPQTVRLGRLNVLIGANASGKSNFVDAFRFIQDCLADGISGAVARRFGWRNTLARRLSARGRIRLELGLDSAGVREVRIDRRVSYKPDDMSYVLELAYAKEEPYVRKERFAVTWRSARKRLSEHFERDRASVRAWGPGESEPRTIAFGDYARDRVLLEAPLPMLSTFLLSVVIRGWRFYELDVRAARMPSAWDTEDILMGDGRNLSRVLESIGKKGNRRLYDRLCKLMGILVPGFVSWRTEHQSNDTIVFNIQEKGVTEPFPPSAISDGTVRLLAILLAVLHQPRRAGLICIDEPERCVHPQILKTLVEVIREASEQTQIIVTTHSAQLVRWLKPSEALLVDKKGNQTMIARAQDVKHIDKFLEEFSLDELWLSGYLEGGTAL